MGKKSGIGCDKQTSEKKRSIINTSGSKETKEEKEKEKKVVDSYTASLENRIEFLESELESTIKELDECKEIIKNSEPAKPYFGQTKHTVDGDLLIFDGDRWVPQSTGFCNHIDYDISL